MQINIQEDKSRIKDISNQYKIIYNTLNSAKTTQMPSSLRFLHLAQSGTREVCVLPTDGELWVCQQILAEHGNVTILKQSAAE